jgi:hypothetical protein
VLMRCCQQRVDCVFMLTLVAMLILIRLLGRHPAACVRWRWEREQPPPPVCAPPTDVTGVIAVATDPKISTFAATVTCACGYSSTLGTPTKCSSNNAAWTYTGTCTKIATPTKCLESVQYNMWCNAGKEPAAGISGNKDSSGFISTTGTTPDQCITMCIASATCAWVGHRKSDNYCEFWAPNSCYNANSVPNHDIYRVVSSCTAASPLRLEAGDEEETELEPTAAAAATATSTATTASSPAEVARTVFGGIIAACCLYVAYRVGIGIHKPAISKDPAPDYTNAEAEISEI